MSAISAEASEGFSDCLPEGFPACLPVVFPPSSFPFFGAFLFACVFFKPFPSETTSVNRRCTSRSTLPGDAERVVFVDAVPVLMLLGALFSFDTLGDAALPAAVHGPLLAPDPSPPALLPGLGDRPLGEGDAPRLYTLSRSRAGDAAPLAMPRALDRNLCSSLALFSVTYAVGSNRGDRGVGERPLVAALTDGEGDLPL